MEDAKVILLTEELEKLKQIQNDLSTLVTNLGSVEFQIQQSKLSKSKILSNLANVRQYQDELGAELTKKYGNGTVDMDTGEFTLSK
jgi:hypothetical protein